MYSLALVLISALPDSNSNSSDWWSLRALKTPASPAEQTVLSRTPIDRFVQAKLAEHGLAPSPEADRQTLIRRVTYNLHGLPPTPEEIDQFVNDRRPDAWERVIDRLLESPRYGERWGRHWLDVVHFGETHGYDKDKPRPNAWPYRDYVIRSFNTDKPYGRFIQEQLAGDVLYPEEPDGIIATGFIAAGPWDFVGHVELPESKTDGLIARYNDRDDMVMTTMSTFASLTVHCARCHDHKFDPISMEDYYRLQAVFAGVDRADRPFDPDRRVHGQRRKLLAERSRIEDFLKSIESRESTITSPEIEALDRLLSNARAELAKLPAPKPASPSNGYHSAIMPTADHEKWVQVDLGRSEPIDEIKLVPARPTDFPDTPGFGFPLRYRVELSDDAEFTSRRTVVDRTATDQPYPGDQPVTFAVRKQSARFVRVTATRLWKRTEDYVFALAELEVTRDGANMAREAKVSAYDSIEAGRWSTKYLVDGYSSRRPLVALSGDTPEMQERLTLEREIASLARQRQERVEERMDASDRAAVASARSALERVNRELEDLPAVQMVYGAASKFPRQGSFAPAGQPRPIHLLERGDVTKPGPVVKPGAIGSISQLTAEFELADPGDEGSRRAALAHWITDRRNPLTWRSIVNRVWQYHFGRGIVDTPNDFGRMGAEPTHPELLDWLALWFLENGQSLKALHRLILTSHTYRQTSAPVREDTALANNRADPASRTLDSFRAATALDSDNRFLWRMNRARLDAESIRDAALFVSGRLDMAMGGPSVQQFYYKDDHSPVYDYSRFDVDSPAGYRRSVYRFIVRSVPDPFMDCLDCADPSLLVPKRTTTLTALQALAMLNNQVLVRAAEHLSDRVSREAENIDARIELVYRLALGRLPYSSERALFKDYVATHGLTSACRLILNSNEFVFVD